jgi:hypothetical protein
MLKPPPRSTICTAPPPCTLHLSFPFVPFHSILVALIPAPMHRPAQPSRLSQAQPQGSSTTPQHQCDRTSIIRVCLSHFPVSSFPFVRPFWVPYYTTLTYSFRLVPLCLCLAPRSYPRYRLHFHVLRFVSRAHCLSLYSDSLSLSLGLFSAPFYSYSYS